MSSLLLDTTFFIDLERSGDDLAGLLGSDDDVAISAVTFAELRQGALLLSGPKRAASMAYVDHVATNLSILGYDIDVAETHARLLAACRQQGRPRGAHDLIIAATAAASRRTLVTADAAAYDDLPGVEILPH